MDYDIHDDLQVISASTLILHGDADPILPKFAEQIHQCIPNSEFILLEDTGHFIFVEAQDEFLSKPSILFNSIVSKGFSFKLTMKQGTTTK